MDISPLFETIDDPHNGTTVLCVMLAIPLYRALMAVRGDWQEVILGYSDSKETAVYLIAIWPVYRAELTLVGVVRKNEIRLRLFHDGGSIVGRRNDSSY